jgi:hypothetical protein
VIVRILGEGQYAIDSSHRDKLDTLDASLMDAVTSGDEAAFSTALDALITEIRSSGAPVPADDFAPSDLVVPFSDATLDETRGLLAEPGGDAGSEER